MTELLQDEHTYRRMHAFMRRLQQYFRKNALAVPLKAEDDPLPEHDIVLYMPPDDSLQRLLQEYMEVILTLLPEEVVVVSRGELEVIATVATKSQKSGVGFGYVESDAFVKMAIRGGLMYVQSTAYRLQHERQEREGR